MTERIDLEGRELVDHYLNDDFWEGNPEDYLDGNDYWLERPNNEEVRRLNFGELPHGEDDEGIAEFIGHLEAHPQIGAVEHHEFKLLNENHRYGDFSHVEVITFHGNDPRDGQQERLYPFYPPTTHERVLKPTTFWPGKYYKFDIHVLGGVCGLCLSYDVTRWSDTV